MREQIGTVAVTRTRLYKLDPDSDSQFIRTEVIVSPGEYPVYLDGMSHYWRMTGVINHASYRMGDGAFGMHKGDVPSDDDVVFYSKRYGPDEFAALLAEFRDADDPALVFEVQERTWAS